MKALLMDIDGEGLMVDLGLRAQEAGHQVRYWRSGINQHGEGLLRVIPEWEESMDWAELVVLSGNSSHVNALAPFFGKGYPIFGTNAKAAELELDRAKGQEVLSESGVEVAAYEVVEDLDEAERIIAKTGKAYAIKPWGGEADKSMTMVASTPSEAVFMLERWKQQGLQGHLMLQEKISGVEIGISAWFGPGGWSRLVEESFEHKRLMPGDFGPNTGEMGTVIRHVERSKLFEQVLEPVGDYLHSCNFVGDCSVNCIIDDCGQPWPLEFTMRLGWPDFCIRQAVIQGDPLEWMANLLHGSDTFEASTETAVGVLIAHADFPTNHDTQESRDGFPILGVDRDNMSLQQVRRGTYAAAAGGRVVEKKGLLTAGNYLMVALGAGRTVKRAAERAYEVAGAVELPGHKIVRNDIGARLETDLPLIQEHGYAEGMKYG